MERAQFAVSPPSTLRGHILIWLAQRAVLCCFFLQRVQMNCRNPEQQVLLCAYNEKSSLFFAIFRTRNKNKTHCTTFREPQARALPASCKSAVTASKSRQLYDRFMGDMRADKFLEFQLKSLRETRFHSCFFLSPPPARLCLLYALILAVLL